MVRKQLCLTVGVSAVIAVGIISVGLNNLHKKLAVNN